MWSANTRTAFNWQSGCHDPTNIVRGMRHESIYNFKQARDPVYFDHGYGHRSSWTGLFLQMQQLGGTVSYCMPLLWRRCLWVWHQKRKHGRRRNLRNEAGQCLFRKQRFRAAQIDGDHLDLWPKDGHAEEHDGWRFDHQYAHRRSGCCGVQVSRPPGVRGAAAGGHGCPGPRPFGCHSEGHEEHQEDLGLQPALPP